MQTHPKNPAVWCLCFCIPNDTIFSAREETMATKNVARIDTSWIWLWLCVCVWVWEGGCVLRMLLFAVSVLGITFISPLCLLWVCKFKVNFVFFFFYFFLFHSPSFPTDNKVQLVKGPKPLVYHRFYLDIEQHQIATKIETTIKQLGGVSMKNHCPLLCSSLTVRDRSIRPETENYRPTGIFPQNEEQTLSDRQKRVKERESERKGQRKAVLRGEKMPTGRGSVCVWVSIFKPVSNGK